MLQGHRQSFFHFLFISLITASVAVRYSNRLHICLSLNICLLPEAVDKLVYWLCLHGINYRYVLLLSWLGLLDLQWQHYQPNLCSCFGSKVADRQVWIHLGCVSAVLGYRLVVMTRRCRARSPETGQNWRLLTGASMHPSDELEWAPTSKGYHRILLIFNHV